MTDKEVIEKLIPYYVQIEDLSDETKEILKAAKDAGLDAPALAKIAKAKAVNKIGDLFDKTDALLNLMEPFVNS